ncbi:hypothetical protein D3C86_1768450 [compost metagenome]
MGNGGGAGQGQSRDHGENGGECNSCQESEHQIAAQGLGQVHDCHVDAAKKRAANDALFKVLWILTDDADRSGA